MSRELKVCAQIAQAMKDGGYYNAVMSGGRELDPAQVGVRVDPAHRGQRLR